MNQIPKDAEALRRCLKAVNEITYSALTVEEQAALAKALNAYREGFNGQDALIRESNYRGAVDFLWLAFRISHEQKMSLLDLIG